MNIIGVGILLILIFVVLGASRRVAILGMMAGVMFLTQAQEIEVLGLHLFALRFLELAGIVRVMARGEFSFNQLNRIDRALLCLYGFTTVVFLLRSPDRLAYQIGVAGDAILSYLLFRGLLRDMEDFRWFLRAFILLLAPYTLLVTMQSLTGHNPFTLLVADDGGDWRNGRPRCFGSFREPDLLGMFAASFIPLYAGLGCIAKERKRALLAIGLCLIIAWAANSGGAAGAAGTALACWGFWLFRTKMRQVRWGIMAMIVLLALLMKSPVWYIFERISEVTGGDGWHRSYLIDVSLRNLNEWWLAGMPERQTFDWFPYHNAATGAADITDLYINFGLTAGLGAVALFILLLTRAFSSLGHALAVVHSGAQQSRDDEFLLWGLGGMLVVHIIDWFGITYFDQMYMVWFMQLAAISTLSQACLARKATETVEETVIKSETGTSSPIVGLGHAD